MKLRLKDIATFSPPVIREYLRSVNLINGEQARELDDYTCRAILEANAGIDLAPKRIPIRRDCMGHNIKVTTPTCVEELRKMGAAARKALPRHIMIRWMEELLQMVGVTLPASQPSATQVEVQMAKAKLSQVEDELSTLRKSTAEMALKYDALVKENEAIPQLKERITKLEQGIEDRRLVIVEVERRHKLEMEKLNKDHEAALAEKDQKIKDLSVPYTPPEGSRFSALDV